jgi:SulP family sulfate permease
MLNTIGKATTSYFLKPISFLRSYKRGDLQPDLMAGLTVAIVLLPQAIAYAMIAELPPQVGLYAAIVTAVIGALWGSSDHLHTGPTNSTSLLVLSILLPVATVGSKEFLAAAGLMAILVGIIQLVLGLARLGILVNFVSDSVIVGFTAGAGVLISANQLRHLLRLDVPSWPSLIKTLQDLVLHITETHSISFILGLGVIILIALLRWLNPKLPGALIGMVAAAAAVGLLGLNQQGVQVIGQLPRSLPPLAQIPILNFDLIGQLFSGAFAVAAIGLVESIAIARSIASQSGQRLDSNQEFIGQGLANIFAGFFSGYAGSGSFTRSGVNYNVGGRTHLSSIFSGLFVLFAMLIFAPLAAYIPRTALAGVLLVTAYGMIDRKEISRIWRGSLGDAVIMVVTFLATLFLPLQIAVLAGILISFAVYIMRTSIPRVIPVLPADNFKHFTHQPHKHPCPQLGIYEIFGDLYFGAVSHIEEKFRQHIKSNPRQRFMLLRMFSVDQIDISGIHALESIVRSLRERGGDVYMMRTQEPVIDLLKSTGFYDFLGEDHFLPYDKSITHLFHRVLDPTICIYECEQRVFLECQNLPKRSQPPEIESILTEIPVGQVPHITPKELWEQLHDAPSPVVIDVREPREFNQGHIPQAKPIPLFKLFADLSQIPQDRQVIFVCRGGRRSTRTTYSLTKQGYTNTKVLEGGMIAWEAAKLLEAVDIDP